MIKRYKTALISGAASGIGLSILKKLSKNNLKIYALDKNKKKLIKICKETNSIPIHLDLSDVDLLYSKLEYNGRYGNFRNISANTIS